MCGQPTLQHRVPQVEKAWKLLSSILPSKKAAYFQSSIVTQRKE
jgi:hypothetical protein